MSIVDPIRVRIWCEAELTTTQLRILFMLRQDPGLALTSLASSLGVTPPSASGLIDRLVRQDFVCREHDPHDRRFVRHHLSERGAAIVGDVEREASGLFETILGRLSGDDLATLIRGLTLLDAAASVVMNDAAIDAAGAR